MRDLRDPQKLGRMLQTLITGQKLKVLVAADELGAYHVPNYESPDCVGRYGRPDEVKPLFMEVQVR